MNETIYRELGQGIRRAWARVDFDEQRLAAIAAAALAEPDTLDFDLAAAGAMLVDGATEQEPGRKFSDLPLVVYRSPELFVQLLVWQESTTAIHQHAFAGAFRVVRGSSIHTRYTFDESQRISSRLRIGRIAAQQVELLARGDVREIQPGPDGLIHALFHIDEPSVTCVVRTPNLPWTLPEYALRKPHLAYAHHELHADDRVAILRRFLRTVAIADPEALGRFLTQDLLRLDFPRLAAVLLETPGALGGPHGAAMLDSLRARHGVLADRLVEVLDHADNEATLIHTRRHTRDPDLRFLLALLLNAPDRSSILRLIAERHPTEDPETLCAEWLRRLASPASILDALTRERTVARAAAGPSSLVAQLARAVPKDVPEDVAREWIRGALAGSDPAGLGEGDAQKPIRPRLLEAYRLLRKLPALKPLIG